MKAMDHEENTVYIEQLIGAYRWHGRLIPALEECRMVLPVEGGLYPKVDACIREMTEGTGEEEVHPWRRALGRIDSGDIRLTILHEAVACMEENDRVRESALKLMEKELPGWPVGGRRKKLRREIRIRRDYDRLKKMPEGKRRQKLRRRLSDCLEGEIRDWMLGLTVYREIVGMEEALRMSLGIVHGFLRGQVQRLRRRIAEEGLEEEICCDFLSEIGSPELTTCMLRCFHGREEKSGRVREAGGVYLHAGGRTEKKEQKRRYQLLLGKGIGAVFLIAAVWIVVTQQGMVNTTDEKETRLRGALTRAMTTTVGEVPELSQSNRLMAVFMQNMLQQVDDDIDLTIRICDVDDRDRSLEVEAIGEYDSVFRERRRVAVRRRIRL